MAERGDRHPASAERKDTIHYTLSEKDNSDRKDIKQDETKRDSEKDEGGVTTSSYLTEKDIEIVQRPVPANLALKETDTLLSEQAADETSGVCGENYSRAQSSIPDSKKQIDAETGPCNRLSGRDQHPSEAETNAAARSSVGATAAGKGYIHIPRVQQDGGVNETVAGQHPGATSASGKTESGGSAGSTLGKARVSFRWAERSHHVTVATAGPPVEASAPFAGCMTQSPSRLTLPGDVTASDNAKLKPEKPEENDGDRAKSQGVRPKRRTDGKPSHQQNSPEERRSPRRYPNSRNPAAASEDSTPTEDSSSNESSATTKANPAPAKTKSSMKKTSKKTASRTTHSTTDPTHRKNRSKPSGSKQPLASSNLPPRPSEQSMNTTDDNEIVNSTQTAWNGDRPKRSEEGLNDSEGAGRHIADCDSRPGGETGGRASAVETVGPTTSTQQSMTPVAVETVGPTTSTQQSMTPEAVETVGPTASTQQSMTPVAAETVGPTASTQQSMTPEAAETVVPTASTQQSMTPEAAETVVPTASTQQSMTPETAETVGPTPSAQQSWPTQSPTATGPTDQQGGPAHLGPQHMASSEGTRAVAGRHSWPSTQRSQSPRIPSSATSSATLSTASSATSSTASSATSSTASSATSSTASPSPQAIDLFGHVPRLHIRDHVAVEEAAMPVDSGQYSACWDLRTGQEDRTEHRDLPVTFTRHQSLLLGDGGELIQTCVCACLRACVRVNIHIKPSACAHCVCVVVLCM